ncbi:MAG: hypothetical protein Q7S47_03025 [bacterium]|nr:hypothetical protein [bacterium]
MLSDKDVEKFIDGYRLYFGKDIEKKEALELATKLYNLMKLIYKPLPRDEYKKLTQKR